MRISIERADRTLEWCRVLVDITSPYTNVMLEIDKEKY